MRVLIAGISTRAAAESAARAGFAVTAIDAFGDLDQAQSVQSISLPRDVGVPFTARAAARAGQRIDCDAVAYLSSFENHPSAVAALATRRALWGNPPDVLRRVRSPALLSHVLHGRGIPALVVRRHDPNPSNDVIHANVSNDSNEPNDPNAWLLKPIRSGGGHLIRRWRGGRLPRGCYLQQFVEGTPGSVVFVASRGRVVPLGVSRQLIGERSFGVEGFRYCGSILAEASDPQFAQSGSLVAASCTLARVVGSEFSMVGVSGIDFVACDGVPYATEVNPRWSSSLELVERALGLSVFGIHAAACASGALPDFDVMRRQRGFGAVGKAVVFARHDVTVPDTRAWLADTSVRDVPHPGERVRGGYPVCTIFAEGRDASECHAALVARAEAVYRELSAHRRGTEHTAPGKDQARGPDQGPSTDQARSTKHEALTS